MRSSEFSEADVLSAIEFDTTGNYLVRAPGGCGPHGGLAGGGRCRPLGWLGVTTPPRVTMATRGRRHVAHHRPPHRLRSQPRPSRRGHRVLGKWDTQPPLPLPCCRMQQLSLLLQRSYHLVEA
jgi:hypothetical protein